MPEMYQDNGLSGTISLADRPGQERVAQKLERGPGKARGRL